MEYDYDWLIVGSGFGGSVSALRLAEKGYRVGVLECGRRFRDEDFAPSTWSLSRFLWAPALGLRGILRLTPFKDVMIMSGSAVGGGSVVYACTLYRAAPAFFKNPQWAELNDWAAALKPHYDTVERMLGVQEVPHESDGQILLKEMAQHFGCENTFTRTPVGIFFGEPGKTVPDPYFDGQGPTRTGCTRCGACMVGCRVGAKNTTLKNYLWFAEKNGAQILPEHQVVDVKPLGAADGSDGYQVTTERPGAWFDKRQKTFTAKGVVFAAGALGTNRLLAKCKHAGSLPRVSDKLGHLVRTNSESILAVTMPASKLEPSRDVAISASIYPKPDTHIEFVTYGPGGDLMSGLFLPITADGTRFTRPLMLLRNILRHPIQFLKLRWPVGWGRKSLILLVMQTADNAISFRSKRRLFGRGVKLTTEQDPNMPNPTFIQAGYDAAVWLAEHTGGIAQGMTLESVANIPMTAHILGGAVIAPDRSSGVVDRHSRVFGYENLLVCDGGAVPANPGVNPSLTIAALAEHAMSHIPPARGAAEAAPGTDTSLAPVPTTAHV
jgi:cholesterol oxidase